MWAAGGRVRPGSSRTRFGTVAPSINNELRQARGEEAAGGEPGGLRTQAHCGIRSVRCISIPTGLKNLKENETLPLVSLLNTYCSINSFPLRS